VFYSNESEIMKKAPPEGEPLRNARTLSHPTRQSAWPRLNCDRECCQAKANSLNKKLISTQHSLRLATVNLTRVIHQQQPLRFCCGWTFEFDFPTNVAVNGGALIDSPNSHGSRSRWQLFATLLSLALGALVFLSY
jgi:hypothetical protein